MLDKVEITTNQSKTLVIPFVDGADGLFIQDIDGLDPVKATLVSSSFANVDGEQYQSSRREPRNLVFKMGVDTTQFYGSVSALRRKTMQYLMPEAEISLRFFSDDFPTVEIAGVVESFDWPLFAQEPEVTISIMCYEPDFLELIPVSLAGTTSTVPTESLVGYAGTIETGFLFKIMVDRALSEFTIHHRSSSDKLSTLEFADSLVAGDVLEISTVTGDKRVDLIRNGTRSSILYAMSPYSNWINLFPGANHISVNAEGASIPYTIDYITRHGGL